MSLKFFYPPFPLAVVAASLCLAPAGHAQTQAGAGATLARRIAAVTLSGAREYARGVPDGALTDDTEFHEANLFFAEARRLASGLPTFARGPVIAQLDSLTVLARALAEPAAIHDAAARVRVTLTTSLGVDLDPLPRAPPTLARGAAVYDATCARCHGEAGAGDGPAAAGLTPPPADLTDRTQLAATAPLDLFRAVTVGVAGTAMPAYDSVLPLEDRWAVTTYVTGLRYAGADRADGRRWLEGSCPSCLVAVSNWADMTGVSDDSLRAAIAQLAGREPPDRAVAFARTAGAADVLGADAILRLRRAAERAEGLVADAVAQASAGDGDRALGTTVEAYLVLETVERDVGARTTGGVAAVERAFAGLRSAIATGSPGDLAAAHAVVRHTLDEVVDAAQRSGSPLVLFGQSLVIIVREGLEAILILGALSAFLVKAGAAERRREVSLGMVLAVAASLGTAALFATLLRVSQAQQEAVEGVTMLLASIVLFAVASWMVSKVEAEKWKAFVRAQMQSALGSRRAWAITGVAFLAVYREGVETVLFYAALLGTAGTAHGVGMVLGGLGIGVAALGVIYVGMQRWGVRIPLRPFFAITGALLTLMSVSFAGQGVAELQGMGWVPATPVQVPAIPALGFFPTLQTLGAQAVVGLAFVSALTWILLASRPASGQGALAADSATQVRPRS